MKFVKKILRSVRGEQDLEKLKRRGLVVGENFKRMGGVLIDPSHCWHIAIGNNVTLAPHVHILAHDASTHVFLGYTKVSNVSIGNNVFVGAGTIILPGVNVGNNVVIGAGSVVTKDIPDNSVAVGNPCQVIMSADEYIAKEKSMMNEENVFSEECTLRNKEFSAEHRKKLNESASRYKRIYVE